MKTGFAFILAALLLASCRVPPSPPAVDNGSTVPISYAVFTWKDKEDFTRISEYFSDTEDTGWNCVVRTDPEVREGLYFILAIDSFEKIPAGSTAKLQYFRPDKIGEQEQVFTLPDFTGTPAGEIRLGLTGDAWPKKLEKKRPTAWKISIFAPDGTLLVYRQSFLWRDEIKIQETPVEDVEPAPAEEQQ